MISLALSLVVYLPQVTLANSVAEEFRQAALLSIEEAQKLGFNNFGTVNFTDLKKFAENVPIGYNPNLTLRVENRRCAMWQNYSDTEIKVPPSIYLNGGCLNIPREDLKALALHEILGAGFGADTNYEITLQIKHRKSANTWLLNSEQLKTTIKNFNRNKHGQSGTSTGVGGGGDVDDFKFKHAGLKYLEKIDTEKMWNIPKDLLRHTLFHMAVKPAADISHLIYMRGTNVEENLNRKAVVYVHSRIYRNLEDEALAGHIAVLAARMYLLYAADEMGLVNERVGETKVYTTSSINKACLAMSQGPNEIVLWKNTTLLAKYSETEAEEICRYEIEKLMKSQEYLNDNLWKVSDVMLEVDTRLNFLYERRQQLLNEIERLKNK